MGSLEMLLSSSVRLFACSSSCRVCSLWDSELHGLPDILSSLNTFDTKAVFVSAAPVAPGLLHFFRCTGRSRFGFHCPDSDEGLLPFR